MRKTRNHHDRLVEKRTPSRRGRLAKTNKRPYLVGGSALVLAGLLTMGGAYALWTDSTIISGGTVTAGNLDLAVHRGPEYWDVSPDRADQNEHINGLASSDLGHSIDLAQWRMVPGDKIAITQQVQVTLEGDNLTASLDLTGFETGRRLPINWSYAVTEVPWGDPIAKGAITPGPGNKVSLGYFTAGPIGGDGLPDDNDNVRMLEYPGEIVAEVVIYAEFDPNATTYESAQAAQTLANLKLELNQVRSTGEQFKK